MWIPIKIITNKKLRNVQQALQLTVSSWLCHSNAKKTKRVARPLGRLHSLELFFLDVATAIVVQDAKDLLHFLGALVGEATYLEELLGAEGVRCCIREQRVESETQEKALR